MISGGTVWSAFTAQTSDPGSSFTSGTVYITDNDLGIAMFAASGMRPGAPVSGCIEVTYTGTVPAAVSLFAATSSGTGLEAHLHVIVHRGSGCTSFTPDAADHIGLGPGAVYSGPMTSLPTGANDPTGSWAPNETHAYRFTVDVADNVDAEGRTTTQTFTWQAR